MPTENTQSALSPREIVRQENYLSEKAKFIGEYLSAINAASGSKYDANANVTEKNLATLSGELFKGEIIKLNRYRLSDKIQELYGPELAKEYLRQLKEHELYKHDESSIYPYCVTISMYPYLKNGLKEIGGLSAKPRNLDSFCGTFINLVFAVSAQFAGAVATGEYLLYFDYFARKDLGPNYYKNYDDFLIIGDDLRKLMTRSGKWFRTLSELKNHDFHDTELNSIKARLLREAQSHSGSLSDGTRTIDSHLTQKFQQVVYSLNQPAASRNYQSTFWNISYFDKNYFKGMFESFVFPDGSTPVWESVSWLQKRHMKWFNEERRRNVLTFPVETMAMLTDGRDIIDTEYAEFSAQMYAQGHSFFTYLSDNPDSLASCCRLRNEIQDNTFSYTLGAGGIATGSKSVMTLNLNRLVQNATLQKLDIVDHLREQVLKIHRYQTAFNEILKEYYKDNALPIYKVGLISMEKQYLTIGINGMVEAAEFLGIPIKPCKEYQDFVDSILKVFYEENRKARTKELMFNTEFVPAENLGIKHFKWDKKAGYVVPPTRNCYNSYYYPSEDNSLTILDKFRLHGRDFTKYLDGGSALHMNLDHHLSKAQYRHLLRIATAYGTNYFTFNIPNTLCNDCGHIDKRYLDICPKCDSHNVDYLTRVIGYLKRVSNFSIGRQTEAHRRYYLGKEKVALAQE